MSIAAALKLIEAAKQVLSVTGEDTCASCGGGGALQEHHLVPRGQGGKTLPTVKLCEGCHLQVHGREYTLSHKEMVKIGLSRARQFGTRSGRPIGGRDLAPDLVEACRAFLLRGLSIRAAAAAAGISIGKAHQIKTEMVNG